MAKGWARSQVSLARAAPYENSGGSGDPLYLAGIQLKLVILLPTCNFSSHKYTI